MPIEEFRRCTSQRKNKLFNKILETLSKFTKRINIHNFILSDFKPSKKSFSDINLARSKSHDNINFTRYIEENGNKKSNFQDQIGVNSNKWEALSQINHTPQSCMKVGILDQCSLENQRLNRHKSMSDLVIYSNGTKSSKQIEKLNSLLDFVMSQMLDSPYKDSDKLLKSIQDLIVESGVQIILNLIYEMNESFNQRGLISNPNYLRAIYSPENSSSESDTIIKHSWLPIDVDQRSQKTLMNPTTKEICHNIKKLPNNTSIVCIPNAHIDKGIKHRLNMKNIMSPSFQESMAFKYSSKAKKPSKRMQKVSSLAKDEKSASNSDRKHNGEYSCYVTAKRANQQQNKVKSSSNMSIYNSKCSLENNHAINLSPIPEDQFIRTSSNPHNNNSVILSKSTVEAPICHHNNHLSHVNKSKKNIHLQPQHKRIPKHENNNSDKTSKRNNNDVMKLADKSCMKPPTDNLQITKASSIDCLSNEISNRLDSKLNVKVLTIKYNHPKLSDKTCINLKVTPISFVFAGEIIKNKLLPNDLYKSTEIAAIKKLKSVVSNLRYFQDDSKTNKPNTHMTEIVSVKSKTTFGIDSGYIKEGKQRLQISNYFITADNLNSVSKNPTDEIPSNMYNKNIKQISDWSDYIQKVESENNIYTNKSSSYHTSKYSELANIAKIAMVNNNNDRTDVEISENEQQNTDSSCTFHAVRAKYFKEYMPTNCDSDSPINDNVFSIVNDNGLSNTNDNLLTNTNENAQSTVNENILSIDNENVVLTANDNLKSIGNENLFSTTTGISHLINLDPNPEEIKNIYEKVRSKINVKQISIGRTYSCDENNDLPLYSTPSLVNSQSFITKYNTSTEDEEEETNNQFLKYNKTIAQNKQINSIELANEDQVFININPSPTDDLKYQFHKKCNVTLTSVVDVLPASDTSNLSNFQYPDVDSNSDNQASSINVVYCRNPLEKRLSKRYQKSIPETLLKHTFASQQKIRLKHE